MINESSTCLEKIRNTWTVENSAQEKEMCPEQVHEIGVTSDGHVYHPGYISKIHVYQYSNAANYWMVE